MKPLLVCAIVLVGNADAKVAAIVAGGDTTCARMDDGEWRCWGENTYGQLGSDPHTSACGTPGSPTVCLAQPTKLTGIEHVKQLALEGGSTCALKDDGSVACWGRHEALGRGKTPTEKCVIQSLSGELGSIDTNTGKMEVDTSKLKRTVTEIPCSRAPAPVAGLKQVVQLALGEGFGCATTRDHVSCWGDANDGRLGLPYDSLAKCPNDERCAPAPMALNHLTTVRAIALGNESGAAILPDGHVMTWGSGLGGQLGREGGGEPALVPGLHHVNQLALGDYLDCALADGRVFCWGSDGDGGSLGLGRLPKGEYGLSTVGKPTLLKGLDHVTAIAAAPAAAHVCAIVAGGAVRCWGENKSGQLGTGDRDPRLTPASVPGLTDVAQLALGGRHTCALTTAGAVYCWGAAQHAQLGTAAPSKGKCTLGYLADATVPCALSPVRVPGL